MLVTVEAVVGSVAVQVTPLSVEYKIVAVMPVGKVLFKAAEPETYSVPVGISVAITTGRLYSNTPNSPPVELVSVTLNSTLVLTAAEVTPVSTKVALGKEEYKEGIYTP